MELQLFKPVPMHLLVKAYGVTLAKVRAGDKAEQTQKRMFRLKAELEKLGVNAKAVPGVILSEAEEEDFFKKEFAPCYRPAVENMTWCELIMDYTKLSQYGFYDAAEYVYAEMVRRETNGSGDISDESIEDHLCSAGRKTIKVAT